VTVYIRWKEQDLLALSPLVRLLWGSLIDELTTTFDGRGGKAVKAGSIAYRTAEQDRTRRLKREGPLGVLVR
jgi:hypothetical protein